MVADIRYGAGGHKMMDRIIGINFGAPTGVLCQPASDDAPDGWGEPIDPPPGTIDGPNPHNLFRRGPDSTEVQLQRGRSRPFSSPQICDWRGLETEPGKGNQPILHFHGPFSRYFPVTTNTFIFTEPDPDDLYRPFFYVNRGAEVITSPNGALIRGVAIRDNDGVPEYIIITNNDLYTQGTTEIWVRPISGPVLDWRLLRSINNFEFGIGEGGPGPGGTIFWRVPAHFNRLGTKCVTMAKGGFTNPAVAGRLHRIEFDIGITTVDFTVEDQTVNQSSVATASSSSVQESTLEPECAPGTLARPCPEIPFCGRGPALPGSSILQTSSGTDNRTWAASGSSEQLPMALAFDYKIDTDSTLGSISYSSVSSSSVFESVSANSSAEYQVCFFIGGITGPRLVGVTGGVVTNSTSNTAHTQSSTRTDRYIMDGGRNSFTVDIDVTLGGSGNISLTQTGFTDTNPTPAINESTVAWTVTLTGPPEPLNFIGWPSGTFRVEMCATDIRYGSGIIREARGLGQAHTSVPSGGILPWAGDPIAVPATKNPLVTGPFAGQIPVDGGTGALGAISAPRDYFIGTKFQVTYHIEAENTSETRVVEDALYSPDVLFAVNQMELFGAGVGLLSGPARDAIATAPPSSSSSSGPSIVNEGNRIGQFIGQQAQAVNDRFGDYFWTVAADEDQDMSIIFGPGNFFSPEDSNIGDADYEFQDPVVVTGIPGDNPRFDPVSLL